MAKNDVILLDGIIDQRVADNYPSDQRGEVFELFALEELLKDNDLSSEEIESGWIDGQGDGGSMDFIFLLTAAFSKVRPTLLGRETTPSLMSG